jgi:hypothetical protein
MKLPDRVAVFIILIVALFLVADLFFHPGRSITYDGHVHITTIQQFYDAMKDGEFPPRWANGFANYGLPIPVVAQQTTAYLGSFIEFATHNPVTSYNIVTLMGVFLSSVFMYRFLRYYFEVEYSLAATILFNFAPYRIDNIYMRGAIPELFGTVFFPVVLIGLYQVIKLRKKWGLLWVILGVTFLALSHPMMLVLSSVLLVPYGLYLLSQAKWNLQVIAKLVSCGVLGLLIAGYYLLPLAIEIRYFTYGRTPNHFSSSNYLSFPGSFFEYWSYFGPGHPGPRGDALTLGSLETLVILATAAFTLLTWKKSKQKALVLLPWAATLLIGLFLMTPVTLPLYAHLKFLNNIQYPWRNLAELMFVAPFAAAWLLSALKKSWLAIVLVAIVFFVRLPQSYGKNFMSYDLSHFDFTTANLHTDNMNTVWMDHSTNYPAKTTQYGVIDGQVAIMPVTLKNASREYQITAAKPSRLIDYTFYFPGWHVYIDGQNAPIQYQDVNYRGIITYDVPAGQHTVKIVFQNSLVRWAGIAVSLVGILGMILFMNEEKIVLFIKRTYLYH